MKSIGGAMQTLCVCCIHHNQAMLTFSIGWRTRHFIINCWVLSGTPVVRSDSGDSDFAYSWMKMKSSWIFLSRISIYPSGQNRKRTRARELAEVQPCTTNIATQKQRKKGYQKDYEEPQGAHITRKEKIKAYFQEGGEGGKHGFPRISKTQSFIPRC